MDIIRVRIRPSVGLPNSKPKHFEATDEVETTAIRSAPPCSSLSHLLGPGGNMNYAPCLMLYFLPTLYCSSSSSIYAGPEPPHVINGTYDRSWVAHHAESRHDIEQGAADEWQATLIGVIAQGDCQYDPLTLRHAQRYRPSRLMRTLLANRSHWSGGGDWHSFFQKITSPCGLALYEPRRGVVDSLNMENLDASVPTRSAVQHFVQRTSRVETFSIANRLDKEISLHWFDSSHEEGISADPWREVARIPPGNTQHISSFISHVFAVADLASREFVAKFVCRGESDVAVVDTHALDQATTCSHQPSDTNAPQMYSEALTKLSPGEAVAFAAREVAYDMAMQKRLALSDVQTNLVPNVTTTGFQLVRMPQHTYDIIFRWYTDNHLRLRRPESDGGPLYNQRAVPTWHTPLPGPMKRMVFDQLKTIMEEWAPTTAPLHGTSAYGVRTYDNGSYLHLHVDTANTHVVSGIVNVDQSVRRPWPVTIFDHDGKLHELVMKPGDMLLYESAKLLHGRVQPLDGDFYANVFVHYAPDDWPVSI